MSTYARAETLVGTLAAPLDAVRSVLLVVAFSLFVALSAQVVIPLPWTPVPITGQSFAVLLTGALLGSRLGALALITYLAEGAIGLPVFRGLGGGAHYLFFSPTTGYLLAFPIAAFVTGALAERGWDRHFLTAAAAMAVGSFVILGGGWLWLSLTTRTASDAFLIGVLPFIPGDIIKISLASALLPTGWTLLKRKGKD